MAIYNINELGDALRLISTDPVHVGSERIRLVCALKEYIRGLER